VALSPRPSRLITSDDHCQWPRLVNESAKTPPMAARAHRSRFYVYRQGARRFYAMREFTAAGRAVGKYPKRMLQSRSQSCAPVRQYRGNRKRDLVGRANKIILYLVDFCDSMCTNSGFSSEAREGRSGINSWGYRGAICIRF